MMRSLQQMIVKAWERLRPEASMPDVDITPDDEKEASSRGGEDIRREFAHLRTRAFRLAAENRRNIPR